MTLQVSQYAAPGNTSGGDIVQIPFGPPLVVDSLANAGNISISGAAGTMRIVRILAKGSDHNIAWPAGGETFKDGVPEYRALAAGTQIIVAAAS